MTDREKKLAEIREALEKATPGPWNIEGTEIWYRGDSYAGENPHVWIADIAREANIHLIANAPEWLRFLLSELERIHHEWISPDTAQKLLADIANKNEQLDREREENRKLRAELEDERRQHEREILQHDELREAAQKLIGGLNRYLKELDKRGQKAYQNYTADSDSHQLGMAEAYEVAEYCLREILGEIGVSLNDRSGKEAEGDTF